MKRELLTSLIFMMSTSALYAEEGFQISVERYINAYRNALVAANKIIQESTKIVVLENDLRWMGKL